MKIGMTFDSRQYYLELGFSKEATAEFEAPDTIDAIESALKQLGHEAERIGNLQQLVARLASGARWDLVFNVAEGLYGFGREAQVPAILDAYQIPYTFSDPLTLSTCLHKGIAKKILAYHQIRTAPFQVVDCVEDIHLVNLQYPLFAKPVAEGTSKGVFSSSKILDVSALHVVVEKLLIDYKQPVIVEEYLSGREFTVGIIGSAKQARAIGTMEIVFTSLSGDFYGFECKQGWEFSPQHYFRQDADALASSEIALAAWRALGCKGAGRVDVRFNSSGLPCVIEVNPIAGLRPGFSDLVLICEHVGMSYVKLIEKIVGSNCEKSLSSL